MEKQIYEKPQAWVFDLEAEGAFRLSDGTEQFQKGNNYDDSFFD